MRVIFHIGYNKTGSSSIQSFCANNKKVLAKHNINYPKTGLYNNAHYGLSKHFLGHPRANHVICESGITGLLHKELTDSKTNDLLISSEYFTLANESVIDKIKDAFDEEFGSPDYMIVIYLRRHDLWLESLFNEAVKNTDSPPWALSIEDFVVHCLGSKGNAISYLSTLDRWANIFGTESLRVRPFERLAFRDNDLIRDFMGLVVPELVLEGDLADYKTNESIPLPYLYLIGLLRRLPSEPHRNRAISELMMAAKETELTKFCPPNFGRFTASQRASICQMFAGDYLEIATKYLRGESRKLFHESPA
jgi:hypothetical protein